jgi:hypothetical protein
LVDRGDLSTRSHENLIEFWRHCPRWGETGEVRETDGVLIFSAGLPISNSYCGAFRLSQDVSPRDLLDQADEFFLPGRRAYSIRVRDNGEDDDLVAACRERGMVAFGYEEPGMVLCSRLEDIPLPRGLELRLVASQADVVDLSRVMEVAHAFGGTSRHEVAAVFNHPPGLLASTSVRSVVGYLAGAPVVAAQTLLSHGIGGIYWVASVDEVRGRGMGAAVSRAATNLAFDEGAAACALQASTMGEGIYRRMGYETLYRYKTYLRVMRGARRRQLADVSDSGVSKVFRPVSPT